VSVVDVLQMVGIRAYGVFPFPIGQINAAGNGKDGKREQLKQYSRSDQSKDKGGQCGCSNNEQVDRAEKNVGAG
jgi:hypothetical protein